MTDSEREAIQDMVRQALQSPGTTYSAWVNGVSFSFVEYPTQYLNQWIRFPQFRLSAATMRNRDRYDVYSIVGFLYSAIAWRSERSQYTYREVARLLGAPESSQENPKGWLSQIATYWIWPSDTPGARERLLELAR